MNGHILNTLLTVFVSMLVTCLYPEQVEQARELLSNLFSEKEVTMRNNQSLLNYKDFIDDVMSPRETPNDLEPDDIKSLDLFVKSPGHFIVYADSPPRAIGRSA